MVPVAPNISQLSAMRPLRCQRSGRELCGQAWHLAESVWDEPGPHAMNMGERSLNIGRIISSRWHHTRWTKVLLEMRKIWWYGTTSVLKGWQRHMETYAPKIFRTRSDHRTPSASCFKFRRWCQSPQPLELLEEDRREIHGWRTDVWHDLSLHQAFWRPGVKEVHTHDNKTYFFGENYLANTFAFGCLFIVAKKCHWICTKNPAKHWDICLDLGRSPFGLGRHLYGRLSFGLCTSRFRLLVIVFLCIPEIKCQQPVIPYLVRCCSVGWIWCFTAAGPRRTFAQISPDFELCSGRFAAPGQEVGKQQSDLVGQDLPNHFPKGLVTSSYLLRMEHKGCRFHLRFRILDKPCRKKNWVDNWWDSERGWCSL